MTADAMLICGVNVASVAEIASHVVKLQKLVERKFRNSDKLRCILAEHNAKTDEVLDESCRKGKQFSANICRVKLTDN